MLNAHLVFSSVLVFSKRGAVSLSENVWLKTAACHDMNIKEGNEESEREPNNTSASCKPENSERKEAERN